MSDTQAEGEKKRGWRPSPKQIGAAVVMVLAVVFALQNQDETNITLFFWNIRSPLWLTMLILLILGVGAGWLVQKRRD
ncbi:LapA family protein [Kribbella sp. NPDC058693]|uniref:LapA family protein n=1 Tax=Kribbella jiaozuonensis TaxID=2575441 RepID=A0A4U3LL47_9ACTN|nr:LapA family protein [Kribbella jiaozuonensis]TKK76310.1 LapA family protein [Kribbella jiaozuonensis]